MTQNDSKSPILNLHFNSRFLQRWISRSFVSIITPTWSCFVLHVFSNKVSFLAQNWKNEISKKCKNMKSGEKVTSCHHENAVCQRKSHLFTKKSTQIEYDIECTQNKTSIRKISNWNDWKQNTRDIGMSHKIYNCVVLCSTI